MKKILLFIIMVAIVVSAIPVSAQVTLPNPIGIKNIEALIAAVVAYVAGIVGALAVLVFLWAGILFLTSGGSEEKLKKAKDMLKWGVIGLAIALSAAGLLALIKNILRG